MGLYYKWIADATEELLEPGAPSADYSRLDVTIAQTIPFLNSTGTKWRVLLSVKNLLGSAALGPALLPDLLASRGLKREFSGGVAVSF